MDDRLPTTNEQLIAQCMALRHILRQTLFLLTMREPDQLALFEEVRKKSLSNVPNTIIAGAGISNELVASQTEAFINDFFDRIRRE